MENIYLTIPTKANYLSSVRLFLTGLLSSLKFDIEEVEDIKMAVNEGLNIALKLNCQEEINLEIEISDEKLKIIITEICENELKKDEVLSLSSTIIECLVSESYIQDKSLYLTINRKNYE